MNDLPQKTQWELVADAVVALGGKANRTEVWEYLKRTLPDIPFSTVSAELNAVAVNAPARTSYYAGSQPRRTDAGNRYDRLFKVGAGSGAYYEVYDPAVHGVWEIYADPAATSTHKTAVRRVGEGPFSARGAMEYLSQRYTSSYSGTSHIAAYRTPAGRQIAFDPGKDPAKKSTLQVFVDSYPPDFPADAVTEYPAGKSRNHHLAAHAPDLASGKRAYAVRVSTLGELAALCDWYDAGERDQESKASLSDIEPMAHAINKILFGPPGTGKTYSTINETLRILDPDFLDEFKDRREMLKRRFDELAHAGRVRFVTFHQSFSYEDFVEGIRASTDEESGSLRYEVEDGVFKQLCEAARSRNVAASESGIKVTGRRVWKLSLGDAATEGHIFDECMEKGIALMGFGFGADLSSVTSRDDILEAVRATGEDVGPGDYAITALDQFVRRMKDGDLVVVTHGNLKFRAIGVVSGGYQYMPRDDGEEHFVQARPVRWLRHYDPPRPYADLMERRFSMRTIYELQPGSINLDRLAALLAPSNHPLMGDDNAGPDEPEPRVLVIDEINRGNVSRIFGELITLIEPSKREGASEALSVTLPYSKERFSVPANVHLIGTMNTADRSLAGLDVALRRRFEFVEMLPEPSALEGVEVEGVPVDEMLAALNRRIEVLLGRDYMLGHAYFMRLRDEPTLSVLAEVFRRQVLPLLQEYFFEDWQKIAWVLNDHRKASPLRFLQQTEGGMAELFGSDVDVPGEGRLWTVNDTAFDHPAAYLGIIKAQPGTE